MSVCVFAQGDWQSHLGPRWDVRTRWRKRTDCRGMARRMAGQGKQNRNHQRLLVCRVQSDLRKYNLITIN